MRVFALESFDEIGQLRSDGARLVAILARLGSQSLEAAGARVRSFARRATRNSAINVMLNRSHARANSGNRESVRLHRRHR